MLPPVENGPRYAAWILALKEKALALAILEPEYFVVSSNVKFTLLEDVSECSNWVDATAAVLLEEGLRCETTNLSRVYPLAAECVVVSPHVGDSEKTELSMVSSRPESTWILRSQFG